MAGENDAGIKVKHFRGTMQLKAEGEGEPGEFSAVFATLNVIDQDDEVTLPGVFAEGQKVRIAAWGHGWDQLPVGRGVISERDNEALFEGKFFLDTSAGLDHYKTVRNLAELQEWSYGFRVLESKQGMYEGKPVTFLTKLKVIEVSPVMQGAGIDTRTLAIKSAGQELGEAFLKKAVKEFLKELGATGEHEGAGSGEAGDGKPRSPESSVLAMRVALAIAEDVD